MKASLPDQDQNPEARARQLGEARERYVYSYDYPQGVAMVKEVPRGDHFSAMYLARVGELDLTVLSNHYASRLAEFFGGDEAHDAHHAEVAAKVRGLEAHQLKEHFATVSHGLAERLSMKHPKDLSPYEVFFELIQEIPIVSFYAAPSVKTDLAFAWQRIAGPNPMSLRRAQRLPDNFPVTEAHFERCALEGDSLAAALAEGRAYLADYAALEGAPRGVSFGKQKYIWAPIALFVQGRGEGAPLVPVAIQCEQTPSEANPVLTPADGVRWKIARTVVSVADGNLHQAVVHLAHTHLILEAVIMAAKRQLAEQHPLLVLMDPHFQFTLALNEVAQTNLIAPGGQVDLTLAATLEGTLEVVKGAMKSVDLMAMVPRTELAARGVHDPEALPNYPYRDDALKIWDAIHTWVRGYVGLYYESDAALAADSELAAFLEELGAAEGGRLGGVPEVKTVDTLAELISLFIFIASAQHSAVNFPQFSFMGFVPNIPGAAYAPLPKTDAEATEAHYLSMLPPMDQALRQFDIIYQLSNLRDNKLGHYPLLHFRDRRVRPLLDAFKRQLSDIESEIVAANASRLLPYPFLQPSLITASIHI